MSAVDVRPTDFLRDVIKETGISQSDGDASQCESDQEQASAEALMKLAETKALDKYRCIFCHAEFTIHLDLHKHMNLYHNVRKHHQCSVCNKRFNKADALKKHIQVSHQGEKPFQCLVCLEKFTTKSNLQRHGLIHSQEKPHACPSCPKKFRMKYMLDEHVRTHTGERPYKCDFCPKSYSRISDLRVHLRSHSGVKEFHCDLCDRSYYSAKRLAKHKKDHSDAEKASKQKQKCALCNLQFKNLALLENHIKQSHPPESKATRKPIAVPYVTNHTCPECQMYFDTFDDLAIHLESEHNTFQCRYCYLQFTGKGSLGNHIRQSHGSLVCYICDKTFTDHASLTGHIANHDLYTCPHCDASFSNHESLEQHQNKLHSSENMETCTICLQQFASTDRLHRHLQCHLPPALNKCRICRARFNQAKMVERHMEVVHNKPAQAKVVNQSYQIVQDDLTSTVSLVDGATKADVKKMVITDLVDAFHCNVCRMDFMDRADVMAHLDEHDMPELLLCILEQERTKAQLCGLPQPRDIVLSGPGEKDGTGEGRADEDEEDPTDSEHEVFMKNRPKAPTVVVKRYTSTRCRFCDKLLASEHDLMVHEKMHTSAYDFRCMACNEEFIDGDDLIKHRRTHKKRLRRSYQCAHCGIIMNDANLIKQHIETHSGFALDERDLIHSESVKTVREMKFACKICRLWFDGSAQYRRHIRSHNDGKKYKCGGCGRGYHKLSSLKYHEKSHRAAAPHGCAVCSDKFDKPYRLIHHLSTAHGIGRHQCKKCDLRFTTKERCEQHETSHRSKSTDQYVCAVCEVGFITVDALRYHIRAHCAEQPQQIAMLNKALKKVKETEESIYNLDEHQSFWCFICSASFQREEDLVNHGHKHHKCDLCAVEFSDAMELECHSLDHAALNKNLCLNCGDSFDNQDLLWDHTLTYHGESKICRCGKCRCVLLSHRHSQIHMLTHPLEQEADYHCDFFCNICQVLFTTESFLNIHNERHKPCQICQEICEDLTLHLLQNHSLPQVEKCYHCDRVLTDPVTRAEHLNSHALHPQVLERCADCEQGFVDLETLDEHVKLYHNIEVGKCIVCGMLCLGQEEVDRHLRADHMVYTVHKCKKCPKIFLNATVDQMVDHAVSHKPKHPVSCCSCNVKFDDDSLLMQHLQTHDKLDNLYRCTSCSAQFSETKDFRAHLRQDHGIVNKIEESPVQCGICESVLHLSSIGMHVNNHLSTGKRFTCKNCSLSFTRKSSLKRHIMIHNDERPVVCEVCGLAFRNSDRLAEHQRSHSEQRLYECTEDKCGQKFRLRAKLRRHQIKEHGLEAPFRCIFCPESFIYRNQLKEHMKRHGRERKFQCSVCKIAFKSANCLKIHLKNKHDGKLVKETFPKECQVCLTPFHSETMVQNHVCPAGHVDSQPAVVKETESGPMATESVVMGGMGQESDGFVFVAMGDGVEMSCPICMTQFASQEEATSHMLLHQAVN